MLFRTRDLLVKQRTQIINALRGHHTGHRFVYPKGWPVFIVFVRFLTVRLLR